METTVKAAGKCTTNLCHQLGFQFNWATAWALLVGLFVLASVAGWLLGRRAERAETTTDTVTPAAPDSTGAGVS